MKLSLAALVAVFLAGPFADVQAETDANAQRLAQEVWKASGGENWPNVKEIRFTFVVEQDGQQIARAEHHWNVAAATDHVKWKGKEVTVNLAAPGEDEDAKAAYARWVNDSYWLLAPLKVLDPGVQLTHEGTKDLNGTPHEALRLSFQGVGLTPGDQYLLYVDPQAKLVRAWDFIPKPENVMHGTWEKYETHGGLQLSTEHNFGGRVIRFTGLEVITK